MFLTLPYVRFPETDRVHIAWVTTLDAAGSSRLRYSIGGVRREAVAHSHALTRLDARLHVATIDGLSPGETVEYTAHTGDAATPAFTCRSKVSDGEGVRFLLTSDAQGSPLATQAIARVADVAGPFDFIVFPGDLPERPFVAEDWWAPVPNGNEVGSRPETHAFFPVFQGYAWTEASQGGHVQGAPLLQSLPLYAAIGNHDVAGVVGFDWNPSRIDPRGSDTTTFEELFGPPDKPVGERKYYAFTYGNVRVVVLFVARAWRRADHVGKTGPTYEEEHPEDPARWTHGRFPFTSIAPGSPQYEWLARELKSSAWSEAEYRIVALHHPIYSMGHDWTPPFVEPEPVEVRDERGVLRSRRYRYPAEKDVLRNDLAPLLARHGTHLVVYGHSHTYNRFRVDGVHYLESSHLGKVYPLMGEDISGQTCLCAIHEPGSSFVSVVDTKKTPGEVRTICTNDGRVVDAFRLKE